MNELSSFLEVAPQAVAHAVTALAMIALGTWFLARLSPQDEMRLMRRGNLAAALSLLGLVLGVALPVATAMAVSGSLVEIVLWGGLAILLQSVAVVIVRVALPDTPEAIAADDRARAVAILALQLAVAAVNMAATL